VGSGEDRNCQRAKNGAHPLWRGCNPVLGNSRYMERIAPAVVEVKVAIQTTKCMVDVSRECLWGGNLFTRHKGQRQVLPWDSNQRYETDANSLTLRSQITNEWGLSLSHSTMFSNAQKGGAIHRVQPFPFTVPVSIHSPQRDMSLHCRGTILGPPCPIECLKGLRSIAGRVISAPYPTVSVKLGLPLLVLSLKLWYQP
jgi:hypothetical protein